MADILQFCSAACLFQELHQPCHEIIQWNDPSFPQFSQLMLVYMGLAADIAEVFEAFRESKVCAWSAFSNLHLISTQVDLEAALNIWLPPSMPDLNNSMCTRSLYQVLWTRLRPDGALLAWGGGYVIPISTGPPSFLPNLLPSFLQLPFSISFSSVTCDQFHSKRLFPTRFFAKHQYTKITSKNELGSWKQTN